MEVDIYFKSDRPILTIEGDDVDILDIQRAISSNTDGFVFIEAKKDYVVNINDIEYIIISKGDKK